MPRTELCVPLRPSDSRFVERRDPVSGIREVAGFIGPVGQQLFTVRHLPSDRPRGGVVICSPIKAELMKNYRREVLLGRELARRGLAVLRFNYRGEGHSDGSSDALTLETMGEDARRATERFLRDLGFSRLAFLGTRLGALVAAAAAADCDGAPLVLWEAPVSISKYFREVFRARLIHDLRERKTAARPSTERLLQRLLDRGSLDVLGFSIDLPLYESFQNRSLHRQLQGRPCPIFLVQMSRSTDLQGGYVDLKERLQAAGFRVDTVAIGRSEGWWFHDMEGGGGDPATPDLLAHTSDWLTRELLGETGR